MILSGRLFLTVVCALALSHAAFAVEPKSAMPGGLPDVVIAQSREAANFSLTVQTDRWVAGPSFADGKDKWFLSASIVSIEKQTFGHVDRTPFAVGGTILLLPYCSRGTVARAGGPGSACADFVGKKVQVWGLLADMRARKLPNGRLLLQAENLLDIAFVP